MAILFQKTERRCDMNGLIDSDVLDVLRKSECHGDKLYLPSIQLERKLYQRVNEVLSRLGGKWKGGKVKAHVFEEECAPLLEEIAATGRMPPKNPLDFYATPEPLVSRMLDMVVGEPKLFLEPSAGDGAIARAVLDRFPDAVVEAVELDPKRAEKLKGLDPRVKVIEADFLTFKRDGVYDCVVMNPPFSVDRDKQEYINHIQRAEEMLSEGGMLISIAPTGVRFRDDRRVKELRRLIERNQGAIVELEEDAFKASGTCVSTVMIHFQKTRKVGG